MIETILVCFLGAVFCVILAVVYRDTKRLSLLVDTALTKHNEEAKAPASTYVTSTLSMPAWDDEEDELTKALMVQEELKKNDTVVIIDSRGVEREVPRDSLDIVY